MKKMLTLGLLLATAIFSGYALAQIIKKAGLEDIFSFDLNEDIDEQEF